MSHPTHRLTLGKYSEEVTKDGLESIKKVLGSKFAEYTVEEIQPATPAELSDKPTKPERTVKPDTTTPA